MNVPILSLGAAMLLIPHPLAAQQHQIDWGSSAVFQKLITSDGSAITLAEFSVELGGFSGGFVPTQANTSDWVSNWRVFDAVTSPDTDTSGPKGASADGFISSTGTDARFVGTGFLQSDQTSSSEDANGVDTFLAGQQAYVFIRNGDTPTPGTEWLLYTSTSGDVWEYPAVSGGQPSTPLSWFVGQADSAVWGSVNGQAGPNGEHTDSSTDFVLRTHTFVPEPSSVLLVSVGSLLLLRRQRTPKG